MSPSKKKTITIKSNGEKDGTSKKDKDDEVVLTRYDHTVDCFYENCYSNAAFEGNGITDIALGTGTLNKYIGLMSPKQNILYHYSKHYGMLKQLIFSFKRRIRVLQIEC